MQGEGDRVSGVQCSYLSQITEFNKEVSPLLPNSCHSQNYNQCMSQLSSSSEECSPQICADEINDEDRGQVWGESER